MLNVIKGGVIRTIEFEIEKNVFLEKMVAVSKVHEEGVLKFGKEGIEITEVDNSHVFLIHMNITKDVFKEYKIEDEEKFAIDLNLLNKMLSKINSKYITVKIKGNSMMINDSIMIKGIEVWETVKIPSLIHSFEFNVSRNFFKNLIESAELLNVYIKLEVKDGKVYFISHGDYAEIKQTIADVKILGEEKEGSCLYGIEYLKCALYPKEREVTVKFGNDKPIQIEYKDSFYMIAPRIGDD